MIPHANPAPTATLVDVQRMCDTLLPGESSPGSDPGWWLVGAALIMGLAVGTLAGFFFLHPVRLRR
jgi:hypothetical protein